MKLYIGQVMSTVAGTLTVQRLDPNYATQDKVTYASPFGGKNIPGAGNTGFFAIPTRNQFIMYAETDSISKEYIYISTIHKDYSKIFEPPKKRDGLSAFIKQQPYEEEGIPKDYKKKGLFPPGLFNASGEPEMINISDSRGNSISLNHRANRKGLYSGVNIRSGFGKRLILNDCQNGNVVLLNNELGDGLIIGGDYKLGYSTGDTISAREILLKTQNDITVHSEAGKVTIQSYYGNGVEITSQGIGLNSLIPALPIAGPMLTPPDGLFFKPYGNIKLDSEARDVCLFAGSIHKKYQTFGSIAWPGEVHRSRIMLRAFGEQAKIQLNSDGSITIRAPKDDIFIHGNRINIKAETDINLHAKNDINLAAGNVCRATGGVSPILGDGLLVRESEPLLTELGERAFDSGINAASIAEYIAPVASQNVNGVLELSLRGATLDGGFVNLAPLVPTLNARKAIHPTFEFSDYELDLINQAEN